MQWPLRTLGLMENGDVLTMTIHPNGWPIVVGLVSDTQAGLLQGARNIPAGSVRKSVGAAVVSRATVMTVMRIITVVSHARLQPQRQQLEILWRQPHTQSMMAQLRPQVLEASHSGMDQ